MIVLLLTVFSFLIWAALIVALFRLNNENPN